jgi:hypothetical protein
MADGTFEVRLLEQLRAQRQMSRSTAKVKSHCLAKGFNCGIYVAESEVGMAQQKLGFFGGRNPCTNAKQCG